MEDIQKILIKDGAKLQSFLTAENNQSISFLREDMGKDGPVMKGVCIYFDYDYSVCICNTDKQHNRVRGDNYRNA